MLKYPMSVVKTDFWHLLENGKVQCDLCPRNCKIKEGQRGLCFVRGNEGGEIVLHTYGRSSGFCIDPVEKKPLNHYLPGTPVLSFGTAGCNLTCKFCQNWDISKSREMDILCKEASPEQIVNAAIKNNCRSIAFTYNDPTIFLEYARDISLYAREKNIKNIAVTAAYINEKPREEFFSFIDAANVDLKGFSEKFYKNLCSGSLAPVLDTLKYLKQETNVWFEITTLLIPGENDSIKELENQCQWIIENLGPDVPLHFSAFHPDHKMLDKINTPHKTLIMARDIALRAGLNFVYLGNVHDENGSSTYCPNCKNKIIGRDWYVLSDWNVTSDGKCNFCLDKVPGFFEKNHGNWGARRKVIQIG